MNQDHLNKHLFLTTVKQRLLDNSKQSIDTLIDVSNKCKLDRYLVDHITLQSYLNKPILSKFKKLISKVC